jgi:hypothetical protein
MDWCRAKTKVLKPKDLSKFLKLNDAIKHRCNIKEKNCHSTIKTKWDLDIQKTSSKTYPKETWLHIMFTTHAIVYVLTTIKSKKSYFWNTVSTSHIRYTIKKTEQRIGNLCCLSTPSLTRNENNLHKQIERPLSFGK